MAADPISPLAPARVRVLVLPAGRIKRRRFMTFVNRLHHESIVRLGDISPDGRPDRNMFSPLAFPNGALLYHFSTAMPPPSNLALTPYELFREPMMVIGIADAQEYHAIQPDVAKEELERVAMELKDQHPRLLINQLLLMDCSSEHDDSLVPEGAMCVSAQRNSRFTALKTVMCDVSAKFLAELTTYGKAVQALPSIQSPGASSGFAQMPRRPPLDRSSSMGSWSDSPELLSRNGSPAPGSADSNNAPTSFDQIAATAMAENTLTRTVSRAERDGSRTASKDRMSKQAYSSGSAAEKSRAKGKARVGIVIGNLYMMAGRWSDAWRELVENTNKSRMASDHLWHAKGLESIMICMLLFVWTGYDFQIPAICYSGSERLSAMIVNGIKDGMPSLGTQDSESANDAAQRFAELLPDLVMNILSVHDRASTLAGEASPAVAYSESVIRMAKVLAILQSANGKLESALVGNMIKERASPSSPIRNAGFSSGISNHAISDILFRAYPAPTIPLSDAAKILSGIASVLGLLHLQRKRAIVIKELLASLVPALVQARKVGAAEVGIHPAASLSAALDLSEGDKHLGLDHLLRGVHTVYGARYSDGTISSATTSPADDAHSDIENIINSTIAEATVFARDQAEGSLRLKVDILGACIDFCEALPDLHGIVHFAALLLRIAGPQRAIAFEVPGNHVKLAIDEQIRLLSSISRTSNAASKIGLHHIPASYWDDFLIRSVQWGSDSDGDKLRVHQNPHTVLESHSKRRTPFLYDPFAKQDVKAAEKVLVAEEPVELIIKLQNPYDFEIKVESLSLVSKGAELDAHSTSFTLGPARLQSFAITVQPKSVGKLDVVGCLVKIFGCREQIFPIYQDAWSASEPFKFKQIGMFGIDHVSPRPSTKHQAAPITTSLSAKVIQSQPHVIVEDTGLSESALMVLEGQKKTFEVKIRNTSPTRSVDFLHLSFEDTLTTSIRSALSTTDLSRAEMYELELKLAEDPIFTWIRSDSINAENIAPGSTATFEITVAGRPGLGAAKIMFDYAYLGQSLSEVQGPTYTQQIAVAVDITVNASVQLHRIDIADFPSDFAWSNQHRERLEDKALGIRPRPRRSSSRPVEKSSDRFRTLLDRVDRVGTKSATGDEEHCLVLLDLRNAWPNPLTVSVEVRQSFLHPASSLLTPASTPLVKNEKKEKPGYEWNWAYSVHEVIHPGHIARLVLLLPKLQIANPHAPIPLLSQNQRQFVVNKDKQLSESAELALREQFWFREEVLKHVRGSWKEDGSPRHGTVDLRGIRLSPRMIDMLRLQDVDISMTISEATPSSPRSQPEQNATSTTDDDTDPATIIRCGRSSFQVPSETFLTLHIRITNRSIAPIRGILRLQPSLAHHTSGDHALDVGRKLVFGGLLQQAMPTLEAEGSVTMQVGLCALVAGEYVIHALVEELVIPEVESGGAGVENDGVGLEDFSSAGQGLKRRERRVWRATEGCRIIASDV